MMMMMMMMILMQRVSVTWLVQRDFSVTSTDSVRVGRISSVDAVTGVPRTSTTSQQAASVCTLLACHIVPEITMSCITIRSTLYNIQLS